MTSYDTVYSPLQAESLLWLNDTALPSLRDLAGSRAFWLTVDRNASRLLDIWHSGLKPVMVDRVASRLSDTR